MTADNSASTNGSDTTDKVCELRQLYLKDVSYEAPNVPGILFGHDAPELTFSIETAHTLSVEATDRVGDVYDVVLKIVIEAMAGNRALFLIEVQQGGLFEIAGYTPEQTDVLLRTKAPETLFPYVRELVSSLVSRGSFPSVQLRPLNFEALYAQAVAPGTTA